MEIDRRRRLMFGWGAETFAADMLAAGMILLGNFGLNVTGALIAGWPFSLLWNTGLATWLGAPEIHFRQAVCLLLLCRLLKVVSGRIVVRLQKSRTLTFVKLWARAPAYTETR